MNLVTERAVRGVLGLGPRMRRRRLEIARSHQIDSMLAALGRDGCPVCHEIAPHDRTYFFWFFNESYFEPHNLDRLTRSLGFCPTHAARLGREGGNAYQLAAVHSVMVRRVRSVLLQALSARAEGDALLSRLAAYGPCPPCRSREESALRAVFWIARGLENPVEADSYGRPGLLCFPHLRAVLPHVSGPAFHRLLGIHEGATMDALKSLAAVQPELRPSLRLTVGHESPVALPRPDPATLSARVKDPVADLLAALHLSAECPVCLGVRRAWIEWVRWLDDAVVQGEPVDDLLPSCPQHTWAALDLCSPDAAAACGRHALRIAAEDLDLATKILRSPSPPNVRRAIRRLKEAVLGPRERERRARGAIAREFPCAVCRQLATAQDRTLGLLFALVEDRHHRAAVEAGYGLCLRHLARALGLEPAPGVRKVLVEIEAAKLARLQWELEEVLRKVAWQCRAEMPGSEWGAWRRALVKFSGSLAAVGGKNCR